MLRSCLSCSFLQRVQKKHTKQQIEHYCNGKLLIDVYQHKKCHSDNLSKKELKFSGKLPIYLL